MVSSVESLPAIADRRARTTAAPLDGIVLPCGSSSQIDAPFAAPDRRRPTGQLQAQLLYRGSSVLSAPDAAALHGCALRPSPSACGRRTSPSAGRPPLSVAAHQQFVYFTATSCRSLSEEEQCGDDDANTRLRAMDLRSVDMVCNNSIVEMYASIFIGELEAREHSHRRMG